MNRRQRRQRGLPFTLFSFQDIMACITGLVILITLMLVLDLIARPRVEAPAAAQAVEAPEPGAEAARVAPGQVAAAERAAGTLEELLATLEARRAEAAERADASAKALEEQRRELERLAEEAEELQRQAAVERARTRVTVLEGDLGAKQTWFVECGAGDVRVGRIEDGGATRLERRFTGAGAADDALRWALAQPKESERFVLLVRPDGVAAFDQMQRMLRGAGVEVGWDLWASGVRVFPGPGEGS